MNSYPSLISSHLPSSAYALRANMKSLMIAPYKMIGTPFPSFCCIPPVSYHSLELSMFDCILVPMRWHGKQRQSLK
jgi:hypothetical protein